MMVLSVIVLCVMMLLSVVRLVAGRSWYPDEVLIQTGPNTAFEDHPGWSRTRVTFDAEATGFCFPAAWLSRPIPPPPDSMAAVEPDQPYPSDPPKTLSQSLEIILASYLAIGGMPSLTQVAESISLSERSLKRKLSEEGRTYSEIADRVRIYTAEKMLMEPGHTIKEIAYVSGYSGPNNFIRAFRRLKGCTPKEWQAGAGAGGSDASG